MSKLTVSHEFIQVNLPVSYVGNALIDGVVSTNLAGKKLVSDILVNPNDRMFFFRGVIVDFQVYPTGSTKQTLESLKRSECKGNEEVSVETVPYVEEMPISMNSLVHSAKGAIKK